MVSVTVGARPSGHAAGAEPDYGDAPGLGPVPPMGLHDVTDRAGLVIVRQRFFRLTWNLDFLFPCNVSPCTQGGWT